MSAAAGAWLGAAAGGGAVLAAAGTPWARRPGFERRVAPYLRDLRTSAQRWEGRGDPPAATPRSTLEHLRTLVDAIARLLDSVLGGPAAVQRRVRAVGHGTVERVRVEQVFWGGTALGSVLLLGMLRAAAGSPLSPVGLALAACGAAVMGVLARDRALTREVDRHRGRLAAEFPAAAELFALTVAAGEGAAGAFERVAARCHGEVGRELGHVVAAVRSGRPLVQALSEMAERCEVRTLDRFVDAVVVALERGTPLAPVVRAQAADARDAARRELVETAARREVAMLLPVVFLVLPVSVLFALFPGFYGLTLSAP